MQNSPETSQQAEGGKFYDKPLLAFLGAATLVSASILGAGLSLEVSEIEAGNMPELHDVSAFGFAAAGVALFGTWLHVLRKSMKANS